MKWTAGNRDNVEDLRARGGAGMRMGGLGLGGLLLVLVLSWATGVDFLSLVGPDAITTGPSVGTGGGGELRTTPEEERMVDFVDAVMQDAQEMWSVKLAGRYQPTRARIFRDATQSGCGFAQSATGPFYCPADELVYLDLGFFTELRERFRAPGDFAQAYVLAHELGHHVQHLLGIDQQVRRRQQASPGEANQLSVRLELQADCFAGVWGHQAAGRGRAARPGQGGWLYFAVALATVHEWSSLVRGAHRPAFTAGHIPGPSYEGLFLCPGGRVEVARPVNWAQRSLKTEQRALRRPDGLWIV